MRRSKAIATHSHILRRTCERGGIRTSAPLKGDCDVARSSKPMPRSTVAKIRTSAPLKGDCDTDENRRLHAATNTYPNECAAQRRLRPYCVMSWKSVRRLSERVRRSKAIATLTCSSVVVLNSEGDPNECAAQRRLRRIGSVFDHLVDDDYPNECAAQRRLRQQYCNYGTKACEKHPNECAAQRRLRPRLLQPAPVDDAVQSERVRRSKAIATRSLLMLAPISTFGIRTSAPLKGDCDIGRYGE